MNGELEKAIKEHYKNTYCPIGYDIGIDAIDIYDDEKYHEEDTREFLTVITPYITEGTLNYSGEDDSIWRFVFDYEKQTWNEEDATIAYGFEDYTDWDLIQELKNRGYKISKIDTYLEKAACDFKDWLVDNGYLEFEEAPKEEPALVEDFAKAYEVAPRLINLLANIADR